MKRWGLIALLIVAVGTALWGWRRMHRDERDLQLALYGNLDLRQVADAFQEN